MNKELILSVMVQSFKKANIDLAVESGIEKLTAESQVELMDEVVK